ncbi:hypothetical protein [Glycomyces tarimensis]
MPSKRTAHRARARRNRAAVQQWEDKLDLRREVLIAVVGIPAGTVLAWLLAWHRAFVEPLWGSPVSALLIVAVAAAVVAGAWHFVLREENRWWTGRPSPWSPRSACGWRMSGGGSVAEARGEASGTNCALTGIYRKW